MARRRGEQVEVYVEIGKSKFKYGFRTTKSIHSSYKDDLGQTTYAGAVGVFFGCNSPKPPKASKEFPAGTIGSFCSSAKVATLKKDDWVITNKRSIRGIRTTGKTRTVYVEMPGGWKYAWNITQAEASLASELGFAAATSDDATELFWGVNNPKPPRASKTTAGETTSTFIKPQASVIEAAIAKGWRISNLTYDLLPNNP